MRWKATECSNNEDNSSKMEMYELKLLSPPRLVKDLTPFENEGTEVCELIGYFLIYQLSNKYNKKDINLYRDDGLAVFKNKHGSQAERIKKDQQKNLRENDLNIVIKCNLKIVDQLDVTLNLLNTTYKYFSKLNNEINYNIPYFF